MNKNERTIDARLILEHLWAGLRDAVLSVSPAVNMMSRSRRLRGLFAKCFALNGGIFLFSMLFFDYILKPLLPNNSGNSWLFFFFRSVCRYFNINNRFYGRIHCSRYR